MASSSGAMQHAMEADSANGRWEAVGAPLDGTLTQAQFNAAARLFASHWHALMQPLCSTLQTAGGNCDAPPGSGSGSGSGTSGTGLVSSGPPTELAHAMRTSSWQVVSPKPGALQPLLQAPGATILAMQHVPHAAAATAATAATAPVGVRRTATQQEARAGGGTVGSGGTCKEGMCSDAALGSLTNCAESKQGVSSGSWWPTLPEHGTVQSKSSNQDGNKCEGEATEDQDDDNEDEAVLPLGAAAAGSGCTGSTGTAAVQTPHVYDIDIVWSPSFQVPVLLLRGLQADGCPLSWPEMGADFPAWSAYEAQAGASWAFLAPEEHPVRQGPQGCGWYQLHPCRTQHIMCLALGSTGMRKEEHRAGDSLPAGLQAMQLSSPLDTARPMQGLDGEEEATASIPDIDLLLEAGQCGESAGCCDASFPRSGTPPLEGTGQAMAVRTEEQGGCDLSAVDVAHGGGCRLNTPHGLLRYMVAWFSAVAAPCLGVALDPVAVAHLLRLQPGP